LDKLTEAAPQPFTTQLRSALELSAAILDKLGREEDAQQAHARIPDLDPPHP
jgi:hypothetical protein